MSEDATPTSSETPEASAPVKVKQKVVSFLIHLRKMSRNASSRYGRFFRPDKPPHPEAQDLHLWLGRELTLQEFNAEFGPAVKSVLPTDTVFGRAIEREIDVDASGDAGHAAALEALKKQHADEIAAIQAGVNAFTAQANLDIAAANECMKQQAARITELENQLAGGAPPVKPPAESVPAESPAAPEVTDTTPVDVPEIAADTEDKPKAPAAAKKKKK